MSRDGSGTFSLPEAPFVYDTVISETAVNNNFSDIANGLTQSLSKDGQTLPTANLPMDGYKHTGVANATARTDYAAAGQVQDGSFTWCSVGGTADAITLTPTPAIAAYATGQEFRFLATATNTGATTIAVSGLSAKTVQNDGSALAAGDITNGKMYSVTYDGTQFQVERVRIGGTGTLVDPMTTRGDILYRNSSNVTARLAIGAAGTALCADGTDAAWAAVDKPGKQTIWVPSGAMVTRTTNGAASGSVETTTNKVMIKTLDFDASTAEYAQFRVAMPKSWNEGTVTAQFVWSHAATTTNFGVVWGIHGVAFGDDDAQDAAFGTAQTVTDTGGTTNDEYISAETAAVTIAGTPAEGDVVVFEVYRDAASGSDTLAIDARLEGVRLYYTTNAGNDA